MTSFNRRILFWFFLASIILCGLGISTWHSLRYLGFQSRWVNHTYEVMIDLDEVYIQLKEVQSHMRSYTLIGDARYLESYQYAVERAQKKLEELQLSVADNDVQEARLPGLETGVAAVLDFYARTYSAYQKSGQSQALMLIKTGEGQMHIDHVHELIREMRDEELRLLYDRRRETENATIYTMLLGGIGLVACFGIMAFVFWLSNREQFRRTRTETSLQGLLRQMESLNDERHMIAQMSDFLQSCRTNSEAYELIRQNMPRMFPDSHGSLAILSNSRNLMDVTVCWGDDISTQAQFAPEDCWGMRRGKMHVVAAGSSEPDCSHLISRMPESICVPLVAHGETLGLIYVASAQRGYFSDRRLLMLRTVCEQMSLALANMRLQDTLRMQTLRDPLTQLFNRRYMESSLERELLRAKRNEQTLAVLMLDIDHFKRFNDTFGHDAGDTLLKEFAKLLARNVRGEDIACRYGGEEFILILPTAPLDIARKRAEKICADVRNLNVSHQQQSLGKITVSIGIAVFPANAEDVESLVRSADRALYRAKQDGRDRFLIAD